MTRDDKSKISYVAGFLAGTVGSPNDYTKEELRARMRYCVAVLEGEDNPARHLKDSMATTGEYTRTQ